MRRYQTAIREAALQELALKLHRVKEVLECPRDRETPAAARAAMPPVREPSMYSRGETGAVFCFKAGGPVAYESALERSYYRVMEWDYTVDFFVSQPCKVPYQDASGRRRDYVPDCLAMSYKYFVGKATKYGPTVYEVKYKSDMHDDWANLKPKLRAATGFIRSAGLRFRVLTEDRLNTTLVENATFLLGYRGPKFYLRTPEDRRIVKAIMETVYPVEEAFTPAYILSELQGLAPRARIIPWIWNLYADYVFQCDLLTPLTLDTISWRCGDASDEFANCGMPNGRADWRQPEHDWRR